MSIGLKTSSDFRVHVDRVYKGDLVLFNSNSLSAALIQHALGLKDEYLKDFEHQDIGNSNLVLMNFVAQTTKLKKRFTNGEDTKLLLEKLIEQRYRDYLENELFFDVPRLRVIPKSNAIKSGISYNYLPHRDTWYAAGQAQINHWMSVANVSMDSSFYIAPTYFYKPLDNSSKGFDLDEWDAKYRPVAELSIKNEGRPHPKPLINFPEEERILIDINPGEEIVFSGHHLHGSSPNTTNKIRLSIDYRVYIPAFDHLAPANIDSKSTGDYKKFLISHPRFGK